MDTLPPLTTTRQQERKTDDKVNFQAPQVKNSPDRASLASRGIPWRVQARLSQNEIEKDVKPTIVKKEVKFRASHNRRLKSIENPQVSKTVKVVPNEKAKAKMMV